MRISALIKIRLREQRERERDLARIVVKAWTFNNTRRGAVCDFAAFRVGIVISAPPDHPDPLLHPLIPLSRPATSSWHRGVIEMIARIARSPFFLFFKHLAAAMRTGARFAFSIADNDCDYCHA